jgi:hypothetical protein
VNHRLVVALRVHEVVQVPQDGVPALQQQQLLARAQKLPKLILGVAVHKLNLESKLWKPGKYFTVLVQGFIGSGAFSYGSSGYNLTCVQPHLDSLCVQEPQAQVRLTPHALRRARLERVLMLHADERLAPEARVVTPRGVLDWLHGLAVINR